MRGQAGERRLTGVTAGRTGVAFHKQPPAAGRHNSQNKENNWEEVEKRRSELKPIVTRVIHFWLAEQELISQLSKLTETKLQVICTGWTDQCYAVTSVWIFGDQTQQNIFNQTWTNKTKSNQAWPNQNDIILIMNFDLMENDRNFWQGFNSSES